MSQLVWTASNKTPRHRQNMLQDCCLYTIVTLHKALETLRTNRRSPGMVFLSFWGDPRSTPHGTSLRSSAGVLNCAGCVGYGALWAQHDRNRILLEQGEEGGMESDVMPSGMRDMVWTVCAGTVGPKAAVAISWCHVEKCTTPPRMLFIVSCTSEHFKTIPHVSPAI